jgi:hypothetical protein
VRLLYSRNDHDHDRVCGSPRKPHGPRIEEPTRAIRLHGLRVSFVRLRNVSEKCLQIEVMDK